MAIESKTETVEDLHAELSAVNAENERLREVLADLVRLADHIKAGGRVVWPAAGIGTGLADLPRRAPRIQAEEIFMTDDAATIIKTISGIARNPDQFNGLSRTKIRNVLDRALTAFGGPAPDLSLPDGESFSWGHVHAVHRIGEYTIVEYKHRHSGEISFHVYVGNKDTGTSFESLDAALVGAIAYKAEGPNSEAARYFMKMIRPE